ncbi:MAG: sortase [Patescibacteria group bacterium]
MDGKKKLPNIERPTLRPWEFLTVFLVLFFAISVVLFAIDFVPESPGAISNTSNIAEASTVTFQASAPIAEEAEVKTVSAKQVAAVSKIANAPVRLVIPKVGIDTPIGNPSSTKVEALDSALLHGAVRYPGSALLGEDGTVFIFGHQSYLPVVKNQAFKAFNGLQNVRPGDEVLVYSSDSTYRYRIVSIDYVDAGDAEVALGVGAPTLTLVTCDSFGKQKTKRYEVKADLIAIETL